MAQSSNRFGASLLAAAVACGLAAPAIAAPERATDSFIVRFKPGTVERGNADARQRVLDAAGKGQGLHLGQVRRLAVGADLVRTNRKLDGPAARAFMQRLARDPRVEYVEVDRRLHPALTPNDPMYAQQWHYSEATAGIGAPTAWNVATGTGVVVAVLDTGITVHEDIGANLIGGYDFISDPDVAGDGNGRDADGHDTGDFVADEECGPGETAQDSSWHGTHVAGTIAALTNNSVGVAGVAHNAKLLAVRVLGKCGGDTSDIADAIVWAAGGAVAGVPANANPAEVINMSLGGGGGCDNTTQEAIDIAVGLGTTVVVAAGNDSSDASAHTPASCNNVVTVGAVSRSGARAGYSNFGLNVDLSAPGGTGPTLANLVLSTLDFGATTPAGSDYGSYQGTSMASPHVAGVAALMQSVRVRSPALVEAILKGSARTPPIACTLGCGSGLLTAPPALTAAANPFLYVSDATPIWEGDSGTRTVTFTVNLSEARPGAVTFDIATADGTATAASGDYVPASAPGQSIPAGQLSKTFVVTTNGDSSIEGRETVLANVTNVAGIDVLDASGTANLLNDDGPTLANGVALTGLDATIGTQTLYRMVVPAGATNLTFATEGADPEQDVDVYVRRGEPPTPGTFDCISAGPDTVEECVIPSPASGVWYVMLHAYSAYTDISLTGSYTAGPVQPEISVADASVSEGNSGTKVLTFTATLSQTSASPVTFSAATANGTATAGSDYVALNTSGLSIPAGQLTKTFNVTINGDTTVESNETFLVNLSAVSGAIVADGQATGTITNDDTVALPTLSINDASVTEGNSGTKLLTFTVTLSAASASPVTFKTTTVDGTAVGGPDFVSAVMVLQTIPAGQLSKTVSVTINGDTTVEPSETLTVNLSTPTNATILDGSGAGTILNDDGPPLSIGDVAILEGNAGTKILRFTVTLASASASAVTYNIATANGTATAGSDYVARSLANQSIPAGTLSKVFDVTLNGDTAVEANETVLVNLSNVVGANVTDGQAIGTITNDDGPRLSVGDVAILEGNAGTKVLRFTVSLSQAAAGPVTYSIGTANGTATAGSDYVARALANQSIAAGVLSKVFDVTINGDTAVEATEAFVVNLSAATGASILDGQATGTITNDDGPTLSIADVATLEGNAGTKVLRFTVSLSQAAAGPVTFSVGTANGTATAGSDYVARSLANQSIAAGVLTKVFDVTLNGDTAIEANETFVVNLSAATGASILDGQATGTISNDDGPTVSIADVSTLEGASGTKVLRFTVSLSQASASAVTYNIATANGTATAGSDYVARSLANQSIAAGVLTKVFDVTLNGDTAVEANETLLVNLTNVAGGVLGDGQATGTITNDD